VYTAISEEKVSSFLLCETDSNWNYLLQDAAEWVNVTAQGRCAKICFDLSKHNFPVIVSLLTITRNFSC
jgi:hypothetical protein